LRGSEDVYQQAFDTPDVCRQRKGRAKANPRGQSQVITAADDF